jgi:hypothetical protein
MEVVISISELVHLFRLLPHRMAPAHAIGMWACHCLDNNTASKSYPNIPYPSKYFPYSSHRSVVQDSDPQDKIARILPADRTRLGPAQWTMQER